ncbi:endoglucanase [Mycolicibacterium moriokaense]|nr:endoglucanase [Mycolicibacterium moriokaense]
MCNRGRLRFGASVEGGPLAADELAALSAAIGTALDIVLWFEDFHAAPPVAGLEAVDSAGALPIITWEPWHATVESITHGRLDDHLIAWADALRECGFAVGLRFAHEFNGDWYPWTPAHGASAAQFVAAWRHVHDIFRQRRATNVVWLWSPNAVSVATEVLRAWYPGHAYVDVLAVDGYNWGDALPGCEWIQPTELFDPIMAELRTLDAEKPILIAEVGCAEQGGSKPDWIADFVDYLNGRPDIDGFIWFEHDKETDWRLVSSAAATRAMARALAQRSATSEAAG